MNVEVSNLLQVLKAKEGPSEFGYDIEKEHDDLI
jgi:hypothetical protein